ncbi:hypothetical protein ABIF65_006556 [Bradyrhizobium japonicum]|jgi:hypothetical protein|uniref:hypothetical protein n=1 Tax=Bradyrhizobium TaxID=374 RepID=UPI0012BBF9B4|nr:MULTISPECIES: hypothetical protein [Bradyrhizobium]MBR0884534.1 hypothetical protein [Bradyrhizobium liaoningense]MBR1004790.1 hypothetical protein [Bradyrhizobium liaoningense]MBR1071148.1 hypothetical protein [Bradyrhizobium liaoningense]MCP1744902.1 hypothetical protein [Bradyrhizobium japonicum]MCP1862533.1 hypothetical protein [Bradyrhizobium japonicum]
MAEIAGLAATEVVSWKTCLRADKSAVVALEQPAFGLIAYVPHWLQAKLTPMDGDSAAAIAETQLHYQAPCAFAHRNLICAEVEDHHASSPSRNARYSGGGAFEGVTPTVSPQQCAAG